MTSSRSRTNSYTNIVPPPPQCCNKGDCYTPSSVGQETACAVAIMWDTAGSRRRAVTLRRTRERGTAHVCVSDIPLTAAAYQLIVFSAPLEHRCCFLQRPILLHTRLVLSNQNKQTLFVEEPFRRIRPRVNPFSFPT